jgi:hypothetical protein
MYLMLKSTLKISQLATAHLLPGPYAAFLKGGLHGGVAQTGMLWASAHSACRGVWGHAPPGKFWKFRLFEDDSEAF